MKKPLLLIASAVSTFIVFGQSNDTPETPTLPVGPRIDHSRTIAPVTDSQSRGGTVIWSDNFQNGVNSGSNVITSVGTWTKTGINGDVWKHSMYQSSGCWSDGTLLPAFSSVGNGFLLFDTDSANCTDPVPDPPIFTQNELTGYIVSPTINLSSNNDIILEFEYENRWCCTEAVLTVDISTDNGLSYPTSLPIPVNIVNEGQAGLFSQNISAMAGGQSQVKLRFSWNGVGSHYYLAIDDVSISQAPTDDLRLQWDFVSHNGTIEEYSRFSMPQAQNTIEFGASIENFGSSIASNTTLFVSVTDANSSPVYVGSASQAILLPGDTTFLSVVATVNLQPGLYTADFTVTSDGEQSGSPSFGDNTGSRVFEVSNEIYGLDGIGVHPITELQVADLATSSFADGEDGLILFGHKDINASVTATGVQVALSNAAEAGGLIVASLHDSTTIFDGDYYSSIASSAAYALTATDITNGVVDIPFTSPVWVGPGQYYAAAELFSNSGSAHVGILDDITVPQPYYGSMIYIANGTTEGFYSNGNSTAVRLMIDMVTSEQDVVSSTHFDLFPNPTSNVLNVRSSETGTMSIYSVDGRILQSLRIVKGELKTIDLSEFATGVYQVVLQTDQTRKVRKLIIE